MRLFRPVRASTLWEKSNSYRSFNTRTVLIKSLDLFQSPNPSSLYTARILETTLDHRMERNPNVKVAFVVNATRLCSRN